METIELRELSFTFVGPVVFDASLEPEDTMVEDPDGIGLVLRFHRNGEVVRLNVDHLLYVSERPRTIQRKVKHGK